MKRSDSQMTLEEAMAEARKLGIPIPVPEQKNTLGRSAAVVGKAALMSAASVGDIANLFVNPFVTNFGYEPFGSPSEDAGKAFDYNTGGLTIPRDETERIEQAALEWMVPSAFYAKGAKYLPELANMNPRTVKEFIGAGLGGAAYEATAQANPDSWWKPFAASILATLSPDFAIGTAKAAVNPRRALASATGVDPIKARAFQEAGIDPTLANVSNRGGMAAIQNMLQDVPGIGYFLDKTSRQADEQTEAFFKQHGMNNTGTQAQAGAMAKKGLGNWQDRGKKISGQLQEKLALHAPKNTSITVSSTEKILNETIANQRELTSTKKVKYTPQKEMGYNPDDVERLSEWERGPKTRKVPDKLGGYITEDIPKPELSPIQKTSYRPSGDVTEVQFEKSVVGTLSKELSDIIEGNKRSGALLMGGNPKGDAHIADLIRIRDKIDDAVTTWGEIGDKQQGALKRLRGAINQDLGNYYKSLGPTATKDWERFNKFYSAFITKNDDVVRKLVNKKDATALFSSVISGQKIDGTNAQAVFSALPREERQIFSNSLMRELGQNATNDFSAGVLARKWKGLEPEVQKIVLDAYPAETRHKVKQVFKAMDYIENTAKAGKHPGKVKVGSYSGTAAGLYFAPISTIATVAAMGVSSALFSSPKFVNWLADAQHIKGTKAESKHMSRLGAIARATPSLASDVNQYVYDMEAAKKDPYGVNNWSLEETMAEAKRLGIDAKTRQPIQSTDNFYQ